jgi:hypothetical protein
MNFDLRKPLGAMFALLGAILAIYGVIADPAIYQRSFGLNVNLIWGAVMLVFGGTMLWLGRRRDAPDPAPASVGAPREHLT